MKTAIRPARRLRALLKRRGAIRSLGAHDVSVLLYLAEEEPDAIWARGESYMREGIEDFGLLDELSRKDPSRARKLAESAVRSFVDYVREPEQFRPIQQQLLESF